jgi:hypothetical protein
MGEDAAALSPCQTWLPVCPIKGAAREGRIAIIIQGLGA